MQYNLIKFRESFVLISNMLNIFNLKLKNSNYDKANNKGYEAGQTRHYPPANQEWFNSIYAYNKSTTKLLPIADKVILKLIKSYFNLYSRKLEKNIKFRHLRRMRVRRLSTNRILVSRAELKHTNDKVVITLYVYNRQKKYYLNKINRIAKFNLLENIELKYLITVVKNKTQNLLNRKKVNLSQIRKEKKFTQAVVDLRKKKNNITEQSLTIVSKVIKHKNILFKTLNWDNYQFKSYENQYLKNFFLKTLEKEMRTIYLKQIISINKFKFENFYILPLTSLINKVYNKKVEFNLVSLKYFHLNSDIFTETIVTKLKNRNNRLLRVLKASLLKFKLPIINKLEIFNDIYNRKRKMQNLKVNDLVPDPLIFKSKIHDKDTIEQMLLKLYPEDFRLKQQKSLEHVTNTILTSIKHKFINGIRLEAAGRLSRRNTAARSVFKLRYNGNIQNMDSSFKGLSTVLLKGHAKSNLQYTFLKSKIRIGSFGLKGWVSSY